MITFIPAFRGREVRLMFSGYVECDGVAIAVNPQFIVSVTKLPTAGELKFRLRTERDDDLFVTADALRDALGLEQYGELFPEKDIPVVIHTGDELVDRALSLFEKTTPWSYQISDLIADVPIHMSKGDLIKAWAEIQKETTGKTLVRLDRMDAHELEQLVPEAWNNIIVDGDAKTILNALSTSPELIGPIPMFARRDIGTGQYYDFTLERRISVPDIAFPFGFARD